MKKIYFCGSIRGGRADAELYGRLISRMRDRGFPVLTEHVGSPDVMKLEEEMTERQIWQQDMAWLAEADLVVAECSTPSLGVGYELAYAEKYGKPCHILYRRSVCELSALLTGDPYFSIHPYETEEQAFGIVDAVLGEDRSE